MDSVLYAYDIAMRSLLYTRFGSILGINTLADTTVECINKGVILAPKRIAKHEVAEKRGETFLEFINLYRIQEDFDWKRQRTVVSRRGLLYQKSDGTMGRIKADPSTIRYDFWFWSNDLDLVNLCAEKYVQWQQDTPKVTLTFNDEFNLNPDIWIGGISDESSTEDIFNQGQIWCYHMTATIDGWIPKLDTSPAGGEIEKIQLTVYDKDSISSYTTIYVDDSSQDKELEAALRMLRAKLFRITGVDSVNKTFTVEKDRTTDFAADDTFIVENSTENNQMYTVVSSAYDSVSEQTTIVVSETVAGDTVDGNIYKPEV